MKKMIALAGCAALLGALAVSCDEPKLENVSNYRIETYNLVTVDGANPYVTPVVYNFALDRVNAKGSVECGELKLSDNNKTNFKTPDMVVKDVFVRVGNSACQVLHFVGNNASAEGLSGVSELFCELSTAIYTPSVEVPGFPVKEPSRILQQLAPFYTVLNYKYEEKWSIRTFWPDVTFKGKTNTSFPGAGGVMQSFESEDIEYRVVMDLEAKEGPKAHVFMLNAQFAEQAPKLQLALRNLPLTFTDGGYEIVAQNVDPEQFEAGDFTPNTKFPFNNFTLKCGGDLTKVNIDFQVAGRFHGSFSGSYVVLTGIKD